MEQTKRLIRFFVENKTALLKIEQEEIQDVVSLAIIVLKGEEYPIDLKKDAYQLLCGIAALDRLTIKERWLMYWELLYKKFVSKEYDQYEELLEHIYVSIYRWVEKELPESLLEGSIKVTEESPIVIITSQFLSVGHAPTRRVLDYAYTLQVTLGIPVKIINDSGLRLQDFSYMGWDRFFNYKKEFSFQHVISYKGVDFDFFQSDCFMPDLQEIANIIYNIKKLNPRLVLNVGGSCLTSDLCRHFVKTAAIPCSTSIPCTMAEFPIVCRKLRASDREKLQRLYPWQQIKEATFNYIMPDDKNLQTYERKDFGIQEDAWLLVSAGNRMEEELDMEFMKMVDNVLGDIPDSHFLIIGGMSDRGKERITKGLSHTDRIHFAGSLKDGSQAIRLGNVYIQPTRKGGGRAAFEGLYYGVPVITTAYGDTWDVCGEAFAVQSYDEMAAKIREYHDDRESYENSRNMSMERAAVLEDMPGMFTKLLRDLGGVDEKPWKAAVDTSKFYPIFDAENKNRLHLRSDLENRLTNLQKMVYVSERRLRENEWACVFRDTIRGSEWLKDVPLSPGRCAIGYPGLYALYRSLDEFRPKNILEMGLGQSTRVIGVYAAQYGVQHSIVEHDSNWIKFFLDKHGKSKETRMICLERLEGAYHGRYIQTQSPIKYYKGFVSALQEETFDFIFVDGPQGSEECSRVDITELLPECLAKSFVIMLDDSERQGERRTLGSILNILQSAGIRCGYGEYDGLKNTALIVSEDLNFLLSL